MPLMSLLERCAGPDQSNIDVVECDVDLEPILFVADPKMGFIAQIDLTNPSEIATFYNQYDFHEINLSDIECEQFSVRQFEHDGVTVYASTNPIALAMSIEHDICLKLS